VFGGRVLFLIYNWDNTLYCGSHSTPKRTEHDGLIEIAPSYAS
jgi:hypothetical protein